MGSHTLCKEERLCGERNFASLLEHGQTFFLTPYKVFWIKNPETDSFPTRFAVSAPKRRFKRAVKRNLLKRRTREAFRTNKHILNTAVANGEQIHLLVIYASDQLLPFVELENSMKKILQRIAKSVQKIH
jgi:ribonuclease P protein component